MINKIKALLILFIVANTTTLYSNEENNNFFRFTVSPAIAFLYGSINEYVFDEGEKVSQLDWDIKPMILAGTKLSAIYYGFNLTGNLFYAINNYTGDICDYDWDISTGEMTNYSKHHVSQKGSIFSNVSLNYSFSLLENLYLLPIVGINYNNIQLTAEDGFLEYPPGSTRVDVYGKGIIYEQKYFIPYAGIGIEFDLKSFMIKTLVEYTRYLKCAARDSHVKRNIDFYDNINRAVYYHIEFEALYNVTANISISMTCGWTYIPLAKGSSYYIDLSVGGKSNIFNNSGGIQSEYKTVSLSLNLRI